MKKQIYYFIIFCIWAITPFSTISQSQSLPPLERIVNINVANMPTDEFLKLLGKEANISFSYTPNNFNYAQKVNLNLRQKSVKYILNTIFEGKLRYKVKGNYIILNSDNHSSKPEVTPKFFRVSGYILDSKTQARISDVSIYEVQTFHSAISDNFGYFNITLPANQKNISLKIEKRGYKDSILLIKDIGFQNIEIVLEELKPIELTVEVPKDSTLKDTVTTYVMIEEKDTVENNTAKENLWLVINNKFKAHLLNIKDSLFRQVQFSVFPTISTNGLISGNVINDYSFNIFAGYNYGVKKLELGGFFNINRGNVGKCQLAGFGNLVGGKVNGYQAAGFFNIVRDTVNGCQMAGFMNFNFKHSRGSQFAGLANQSKTVDGAQLAGLYNASIDVKGFQGAGLFNTAYKISGVQAAGLFNTAWEVTGSQFAGLFNFAKKVTGTQIGFLNIADTCKGIPIGFLSICRNGYHKIEAYADETMYYNMAFRTGVRQFHNIIGIGSNFQSGDKKLWQYSYGIGTSIKLSNPLLFDIDLLSSRIYSQTRLDKLSLNSRLYIGLDWNIAKKISLAFGPTFNVFVIDKNLYINNPELKNIGNNMPEIKFNSSSKFDVRSWFGWKIGIRFL